MLFEETCDRAARSKAATPATKTAPGEPPSAQPITPTVLVVDDDADLRKSLCIALKAAGFAPVQADCARAAGDAIRRKRPDAALVDLMLPDMTGLELIHEWRINPRLEMQDVPVLVLTGRTEQEDYAAAEVLGVADYLIKPVDFQELVGELQRVIYDEARQAFRSPLTGLPGAVALDEEIRRRMVGESPWAMLTVNIKGLQRLNERYGYQRGDQAIRTLAAALWSSADRQAFHVSGDKFVEVMPPADLDAEAKSVLAGFALFQSRLEEWAGRGEPAFCAGGAEAGDGAPLSLAAVGLVVDAPRRDVSLARIRKAVDRLMRDARKTPGNSFVKQVLH